MSDTLVEQPLPITIILLSRVSAYAHYVEVSHSVLHPPASILNGDPTEHSGNLRLLGLSVFMPRNAPHSTDSKKASTSTPSGDRQHTFPCFIVASY